MTRGDFDRLAQRPLLLAMLTPGIAVGVVGWERAVTGGDDYLLTLSLITMGALSLLLCLLWTIGRSTRALDNEWDKGAVVEPMSLRRCALYLTWTMVGIVAMGACTLFLVSQSLTNPDVGLVFKAALILACNVAGIAFAAWLRTASAALMGHGTA